MNRNRRLKQGVAGRSEPKLGQMFLISFSLHLLIFLLFSGLILPRFSRPKPPVYFVDLLNMPVARPQAGRPDARPEPVKPTPEKKVVRPEPKAAPPAPPAKTKVAAPLKTAPAKAKPEPARPAPAKAKPVPAASYEDVQARVDEMRRRQELEELKQKLAQLSATDSRQEAAPVVAPVGMPEGRGDEAGLAWRTWLGAFFKKQWSLSPYLVSNRKLAAKVFVAYDKQGNLVDFRLMESSGDNAFDDSVKKAVLKEKQLPQKPPERFEEEIVFNLKDLLE